MLLLSLSTVTDLASYKLAFFHPDPTSRLSGISRGAGEGGGWQLDVPSLYDKISGASAKLLKSGERVVLTLTKAEESNFTWHDLRKK